MNVIDHAILIPASPAFIWQFLGDISQNPQWQEDCTNISFLTTLREGKGTRWRYSTPKNKDIIVEITAWYDTLGYEYVIVDGSSVNDNKGRIRLQEIAEGTLVQWTFNYEVGGMFSGLRNSVTLKRSLTSVIQDSLRNLYKLIQNETGGIQTHEAKALVKEAPDVEQRSSYEPRHPSRLKDNLSDSTFSESDYPSEQSISYNLGSEPLSEPPVADDDTKPNPVVQGTEDIPVVADLSEPSFLQHVAEPPIADEDTKPNAPIIPSEIASTSTAAEGAKATVESKKIQPEQLSSDQPQSDMTPGRDIRDTARISVFDVFGLQKPSETEEMRAITDKELAEAGVEPIVPTPPSLTTEAEADEVVPAQDSVDDKLIETIPESPTRELETEKDPATIAEAKFIDAIPAINMESQSQIIESATSKDKVTGLRLSLRNKMIQLRNRK